MLLLSLTVVAVAQKTKTTTVQTSEGIYTIVEYPTGKETVVTLNPVGLAGATGRATILRDPNGATIKLNLTSLPPDVTSMNVYAIDPTGAPVLLGQVEVNNGIGTFTSGLPLTARLSSAVSRDLTINTLSERPDLVPGANQNPTSGTSAGCAGP